MRVKIDFPEKVLVSTDIPVRITDINYGDHLGNDAILSMMHEARIQFLNHFGWTEMDMEGVNLIMADVMITYKSQGYYGDLLRFEIAVNDITRAGFGLFYRITNSKTGQIMALAKTGMVCFDYDENKIVSLPESAKKQFV